MELKRFHTFLFLGLFLVFLSAGTAAQSSNWNLNVLSEPYSHIDVSNNTWSVQVVNLTDSDDDPVDAERLANDDAVLNYVYNQTGEDLEMTNLNSGYYYANISVNSTRGKFIEFELLDDSSDGFEDNVTRELNIGNLTVEILTQEFYGKVDPGASLDLKVNVTDKWNNEFEGDAGLEVDFYITNGSWVSGITGINNKESGSYWKNFGADFDLAYNSSYVVHANATYTGASYLNANGSNSMVVKTLPKLEGEVISLNTTEGCNNNTFFTECERGASIDTEFNITSATAENVNLTVFLEERNSGDWVIQEWQEMSEGNGVFSGSFEIPDINTSNYTEKVIAEYNASGTGRSHIIRRNITYRSFRIQDKSSPSIYQGDSHDVELLFARYFTLKPLNASRFRNASINITEPGGDHFEGFNLSDMEYSNSNGLFSREVNIPADAEPGSYELEVVAFNKYLKKVSLGSGFNVQNSSASFNVSDDIDEDFNKTGIHEVNVTLMNKLGTQREIEAEVTGDIENFTEINNGTNITLPGDGKTNTTVTFNITYVDDYEGEIEFTDAESNYSKALDIDIEGVDCDLRNGTLCLESVDDWENVSGDERGSMIRTVDVIYLGKINSSTTVNGSVTGDILPYLELDPASIDLDDVNDTETVTLNYSLEVPGNFTGTVRFWNPDDEEVSFNTSLESNVPPTDTGLRATESIDLGYLPSGSSATADIELQNTGGVDITNVSVSSSVYDVSMEYGLIEADTNATRELEFIEVQDESGSVTVTGETSQGDATATISVTANPVPNYAQQTSSLESRIQDLTARATSEDTRTRLQDLETELAQIETLYQQEDYEQAEQNYNSVRSELDSIEGQISAGSRGDTDGTGGTGQGSTQNEGGLPILPAVAALFVVLLVGFVAYTSMIPEEGDPLYGVLGE